MLLVFLDAEMTGLNPARHRIIDIAFTIVDATTGRHILTYESMISQPKEVFALADSESLIFTGITYEMTLQGKPETVVTSEIINELNRAQISQKSGVFICQNPSIDRPFFCQLVDPDIQEKYRWPYHWLDLASMYYAIRLTQDKWTLKTLKEQGLSKDKIANFYGLPPETRPHRARNGVEHLMMCYDAMFSILKPS